MMRARRFAREVVEHANGKEAQKDAEEDGEDDGKEELALLWLACI